MTEIRCTNCRNPYPHDAILHRCPVCGGIYDFVTGFPYQIEKVDRKLPGIWKYRHTFGLPDEAPVVSLGEGNTPLAWIEYEGRRVAFKLETLNPTGSFKDRGSAVLSSFLLSRGVTAAIEDSSGNAGASLAAYAAHCGIRARIFVPHYASGSKRLQIQAYGAEIVSIQGSRSQTSRAALEEVEKGAIYASHAYLPQLMAGYATAAYEIFDQLGESPGSVIVPAGQGNFLLGLSRGFEALKAAGLTEMQPVLVGAQALACAPLWAVWRYGSGGLGLVAEGETMAEGVRVKDPMRGDAVLKALQDSGGAFVAVGEEAILPARDQLLSLGFNVEPTSAIAFDAYLQVRDQIPSPCVVILTGAGFDR